jgi:serine/threonine protein phosphatase PrpC
MVDAKSYVQTLFNAKGINVSNSRQVLFDEFVSANECINNVQSIVEKQNQIMENWKIKNRISDIIDQPIAIPNATIGKLYEVKLDFETLNLRDLTFKDFSGLEEIGLKYNTVNDTIEGTPTCSGDIKINFQFKVEGEPESAPVNEKQITFIINPNPKSLWKNIPSDKSDMFWKEDDISTSDKLGDRSIVVSSKRGRSHQNVGSFRDDDFAFKYFESTGWSLVAVSDGAGSYSLSRKGSQLACNSVVEYFDRYFENDMSKEFEDKIHEYANSNNDDLIKDLELLAKRQLYKATVHVHNRIKEHSEEIYKSNPGLFNNPKAKSSLDYYHSTLIFALFKKYAFGHVILTFGVGDCPIAIMNKDQTETSLLNWLDVGEFGGGTRFITQADIFHSTERPMVTRFNFKIVSDFSFLFLMTDGVYDPKFVVEANLEKNEKWNEFLADLQGNNGDNIEVSFDSSNTEIANQLSIWMDFWSPGNHDDRTLAIIY